MSIEVIHVSWTRPHKGPHRLRKEIVSVTKCSPPPPGFTLTNPYATPNIIVSFENHLYPKFELFLFIPKVVTSTPVAMCLLHNTVKFYINLSIQNN